MITSLEEIKKFRKKSGLTQAELAKRAGVSQSLIAKIEAGKIEPTFEKVKKISAALSELDRDSQFGIEEVMQRKIISCNKDDFVAAVVKKMRQFGISQVPVIDDGNVIGLVTETTILNKISEGKNINELHAEQVMDEAPPIVNSRTSAAVVSQLLRHFPIVLVANKGRLVGLISKYDMVAVASKLK
ncbi:CBS domain-containing protein [Candidatus Woesearchaeota archaeon]|nr:CBS domain-containing protein [Candidatus Woesearchaeota archaeon]